MQAVHWVQVLPQTGLPFFMEIVSTGQTATHFPQELQVSSTENPSVFKAKCTNAPPMSPVFMPENLPFWMSLTGSFARIAAQISGSLACAFRTQLSTLFGAVHRVMGAGVSAAYVNDPVDVNRDANYIRRVTFNVGRVAEKTVTAVVLAQALIGGDPASGWGVQKVVAFVDREGGSFFQEWSALFVAEEESGGRVCFHYPRLSPTTSIQTSMRLGLNAASQTGAAKVFQREEDVEIAKPITALALRAAFQAMPHTDENDGQPVVCYRSYFPAAMAAVY